MKHRAEPAFADPSRIEWANDVLRALATLDPQEEDCIRFSYFQGHTNEHIAQNTGMSLSSVSRVIAHGMRQLAFTLTAAPPTLSPPLPASDVTVLKPGPDLAFGA